MEDQSLTCRDCQQPFVFTVGEQKFFAERQFTPPTRCKNCRQARKQAKEAEAAGGTFNKSGGFSSGHFQPPAPPAPQVEYAGRRRSGGGGGGRRRRDGDYGSGSGYEG